MKTIKKALLLGFCFYIYIHVYSWILIFFSQHGFNHAAQCFVLAVFLIATHVLATMLKREIASIDPKQQFHVLLKEVIASLQRIDAKMEKNKKQKD